MKFKLFILALITLSSLSSCQPKKKEATKAEILSEKAMPTVNDLPNLKVNDLNGSSYILKDLLGDIILIYFNPDCDHCQNEAKAIASHKNLFADKQLYFITAEAIEAITKFVSDYHLAEPNFHFSKANPSEVYFNVGNFSAMPTIYLYRNKKLIGRFEGTTPAEDLANVFSVK